MRVDLIPARTLVQAAEARRQIRTMVLYHIERALPTVVPAAIVITGLLAFGWWKHQEHVQALTQAQLERDYAAGQARGYASQVRALRAQVPANMWGCSGVSQGECADRLQIAGNVLQDTARSMRNAR